MVEAQSPPDTIRAFVQEWFRLLSTHQPVDLLLAHLADEGLEMVFPERTLRGHDDFRDWYAAVGAAYQDQDHVLERFHGHVDGDRTSVQLTVLWTATQKSDNAKLAFRADQEWLISTADTGRPVIVTYRVRDMLPA